MISTNTLLLCCVLNFFIGVSISIIYLQPNITTLFISMRLWISNIFYRHNEAAMPILTLVNFVQETNIAVVSQDIESSKKEFVLPGENLIEVQLIISKAIEFKEKGKTEKALKLLKQCKSLSPRNADVLNYYGEGIEPNDIIEAEHHYALALFIYPDHVRAKKNRQRCLPLVKEKDLEMLQRIEGKREKLSEIPQGNSALHREKLEEYYRHIYHSNGIEGNTMTLSMTRSIIETGIAVGGKSVIEHNEVLGMDAALKFINNTLVNVNRMVRISDIMEIHKRVLGHTQPLDAGYYRETQVFVGDHTPPKPHLLERYMLAFDKWLTSADVALLHPLELAALAHYKLVYIHPFVDGNGRTSRLLMNLFLMRAGYPPVIIHKEQRYDYYRMLQLANLGDVRPFIRFVASCTEVTLDNYLASVTILPRNRQVESDDRSIEEFKPDRKQFDPFFQDEFLTQHKSSAESTDSLDESLEFDKPVEDKPSVLFKEEYVSGVENNQIELNNNTDKESYISQSTNSNGHVGVKMDAKDYEYDKYKNAYDGG